ncbi:hypothetical protein ACC760_38620, partial [Rhizobium ruizarguesonis]
QNKRDDLAGFCPGVFDYEARRHQFCHHPLCNQPDPARRNNAIERILPHLFLLQGGKNQADIVFVVRSNRGALDLRPGGRLSNAHF